MKVGKGGGGLFGKLLAVVTGSAVVSIAPVIVGLVSLVVITQVIGGYTTVFQKKDVEVKQEVEEEEETDECPCGCDACKLYHAGMSDTGDNKTSTPDNTGNTGINNGGSTVNWNGLITIGGKQQSQEKTDAYKEIYSVLAEHGYSLAAAAGVMGNITQEDRSLHPGAWTPSVNITFAEALQKSGGHWGLIQASNEIRTKHYKKFADAHPEYSMDTRSGQMQAVIEYQENHRGFGSLGVDGFKSLTDPVLAADYYTVYIEGCAWSEKSKGSIPGVSSINGKKYQDLDARKNFAQEVYNFLTQNASSNNTGSTGMTLTSYGGTTTNETNTVTKYYNSDYEVEKLADDLGDFDLAKYNKTTGKIVIADENGKSIAAERGIQYSFPLYSGYTMPVDDNTIVVPISTDQRVETAIAGKKRGTYVADNKTIAERGKDVTITYEYKRDDIVLVNGRLSLAVASQLIAWDKDPDHDSSMTGKNFDIVLKDGTVIPAYVGDAKANVHTGNLHMIHCGGKGRANIKAEGAGKWYEGDKSMLEMIHGNGTTVNYLKKLIADAGGIDNIRVYGHQNIAYATTKATGIKFSDIPADGSVKVSATKVNSAGAEDTTGTTNTILDQTGKCCDCPNCICQQADDGTVAGDGATAVELTETPGLPQGIYWVNGKEITPDEFLTMLKTKSSSLHDTYKASMGVKPQYNDITGQDKWREKFGDGIGTMHYVQFMPPWRDLPFHFNSRTFSSGATVCGATFASASCGIHAVSIVASTMLHKYITPPEIIAASYLTPELNPGAPLKYPFTANVLQYEAGPMIFSNFKYEGESVLSADTSWKLDKARADAALDAGGMVILSAHKTIWTNSGHFIVIREKLANGNYLTVDSSCNEGTTDPNRLRGKPSVEHPWSDFASSIINANQVIYIKPTAQYDKYISSLKKKAASGGSANISSTVGANANKILSLSESEVYTLLFGEQSGIKSYADINKIWDGGKGKARVSALINSRMTTITVPVWKYSGGFEESNKVKSTSGAISVNAALSEYFSEYLTEVFNLPERYVLYSIGGFCIRSKNNKAKTSAISGHSFGGTLDINPSHLGSTGQKGWHTYMGLSKIPPSVAELKQQSNYLQSTTCAYDSDWAAVSKKYGLNWGGNWTRDAVDPMHFSIVGDESAAGGHFPNYSYNTRWK